MGTKRLIGKKRNEGEALPSFIKAGDGRQLTRRRKSELFSIIGTLPSEKDEGRKRGVT